TASVPAPERMSTVGQLAAMDGGVAAAMAEPSDELDTTLENPGTEGNQSTPPKEPPEQPASSMPTASSAGARTRPRDRSTEHAMRMGYTGFFLVTSPRGDLIAAEPWRPQGAR